MFMLLLSLNRKEMSKSMDNKKRLISFENTGGFFIPMIITVVTGLIFDGSAINFDSLVFSILIVISLILLGLGCFLFYLSKHFTTKNIIFLIMLFSFFIRLIYALKTPYTVNQHDLESLGDSGHLEYIYRLANFKGLPTSNEWQFYNPPLHYITSAIIFKTNSFLGFSVDRCFENVQLLSVFWSTVTVAVAYKILRLLKFNGIPLILTFSLVAFYPTITLFGGSLNNDPLAFMLIVCALFFVLKWRNSPNIKYIIFSGIFCGLSMMTKYSYFFVCFSILIYIFLKCLKSQRNFSKTQICFILPCGILGLWYQIRNIILFSQNVVHYNKMSSTSLQYIPDYFIKRIFIIPNIEQKIFCSFYSDTNLVAYFIKSSIFGEFSFSSNVIGGTLLFLNIILIASSVFAIFYILRNKNTFGRGGMWLFLIILMVELSFYCWFNYIEPFGCNMDFRLIPITFICGTVIFGMLLRDLHIKSRKSKFSFSIYIILSILILAFVLFSALLFI